LVFVKGFLGGRKQGSGYKNKNTKWSELYHFLPLAHHLNAPVSGHGVLILHELAAHGSHQMGHDLKADGKIVFKDTAKVNSV
jgi:hypothetical protein